MTVASLLERPKIDPEFAALLPKAGDDLKASLRAKLEVEGCREPLVGWKEQRVLLDGHTRIELCDELDIAPPVRWLSLASREEAIDWIVTNQLAKRNLTDEQRAYFIGREYLNARRPRGGQTNRPSGKATAARVAERNSTSPSTVKRDAEYAAAVDQIAEEEGPEAKEEILSGAGPTRQEVVDRARGKKSFCERCTRDGPVKDCEDCQKLRPARSKKSAAPRVEANGQAVGVVWPELHRCFGFLARSLDALYKRAERVDKHGAIKRDNKYKQLNGMLTGFLKGLKSLHKELTGEKAPEA